MLAVQGPPPIPVLSPQPPSGGAFQSVLCRLPRLRAARLLSRLPHRLTSTAVAVTAADVAGCPPLLVPPPPQASRHSALRLSQR